MPDHVLRVDIDIDTLGQFGLEPLDALLLVLELLVIRLLLLDEAEESLGGDVELGGGSADGIDAVPVSVLCRRSVHCWRCLEGVVLWCCWKGVWFVKVC